MTLLRTAWRDLTSTTSTKLEILLILSDQSSVLLDRHVIGSSVALSVIAIQCIHCATLYEPSQLSVCQTHRKSLTILFMFPHLCVTLVWDDSAVCTTQVHSSTQELRSNVYPRMCNFLAKHAQARSSVSLISMPRALFTAEYSAQVEKAYKMSVFDPLSRSAPTFDSLSADASIVFWTLLPAP